jgi:hypothetical protein
MDQKTSGQSCGAALTFWFCIRLQPREKPRGCVFGMNLVADPKLEPLPCRIIDFSNQVADSRGEDAGKIGNRSPDRSDSVFA